MTIQTYLSEAGMQFAKSITVSVLTAAAEWLFFLWVIRRQIRPRFASLSAWPLTGITALFFGASLALEFMHYPIAAHCLCLLVLQTTYLTFVCGYGWYHAVFESSTICLVIELGQSLFRGGLLAYGLLHLLPAPDADILSACSFGVYLLYLLVLALLFGRRTSHLRYLRITVLQAVLLLVPLLVYLYVRQLQSDLALESNESIWLGMHLLQLLVALCAFIVVRVITEMLSAQMARNEVLAQQILQEKQHRQYLIRQEAIDAVNRKYHDLKHYLNALEARSGEDMAPFLQELRSEIQPYETIQETGNQTLNVLLAERILECQQKQIRFTPYIDARQLTMLSIMDLCTLFGNAMDNAIEACMRLDDPDQRDISVRIHPVGEEMILLTFENTFQGPLHKKGSLYLTRKEDPASHGFGLSSIRSIAQKYGGSMELEAEGRTFVLTILLPLAA